MAQRSKVGPAVPFHLHGRQGHKIKRIFLATWRSTVGGLRPSPQSNKKGVSSEKRVCPESRCKAQIAVATDYELPGRRQNQTAPAGLRAIWGRGVREDRPLPYLQRRSPAREGWGGARAASQRRYSPVPRHPLGVRDGSARAPGGRTGAQGARGQRRREDRTRLGVPGPREVRSRRMRRAHPLRLELRLRGRRRQQRRQQQRQRLLDGSSIFAAAPPALLAAATNNNIQRRHSRHVIRPRAKNRPRPPPSGFNHEPLPFQLALPPDGRGQ